MSFGSFARKTTATLALAFAAVTVQAASYNPTGVQNDVDYNTVLNGGWTIVYQGAYAASASISDLFGSIAAGSNVMLAAKHIASSVFDVLAWATLEDVTQNTAYNTTHQANGVEWYSNGYSMGFAGAGDSITQDSADFGHQTERDRLSWHAEPFDPNLPATGIYGGWRSGDNIWLNSSQEWQRFVLVQENIAPVPEPETYAMLLAGLALMGVVAKRRRKAQQDEQLAA